MMKKIFYKITSILFLISLIAQSTQASTFSEKLYSASGLFDVMVLLCAVVCFIWSMKILSLVRGGLMSKGWQMFSLGFVFLVVARILAIGANTEVLILPGQINSVLYLLMSVIWLVGLYHTKKVLM